MRRLVLIALAGLATVVFSANALAQATVETLMTHSVSSAVGTHAGTALGRAINGAANKLANQTSTIPSPAPRQTVLTPRRAGARTASHVQTKVASTPVPAETSGSGSLIASIQGGEPKPVSCAQTAKTQNGKSSAPAARNCAADTSADSHPSVVNLPAAQ